MKRSCKIFIVIISLLIIVAIQFDFNQRKNYYQLKAHLLRIIHIHSPSSDPFPLKKPKKILLYTTQFHKEIWWENKQSNYGIEYCNVNRCLVTHNKTEYNTSHAILFHARDLTDRDQLRKLRQVSREKIWIWVNKESPFNLRHDALDDDGLFNWTATYKRGSEIYTPNAHIVNLTDEKDVPPRDHNFAEGKDKLVLIIMSNCVKERIELLKKMKKYFDIDLYGECADHISPELKNKCPVQSEKCGRLQKRYKFYFAIENSFCEDYVTEKFHRNSLKNGLVPIVVDGGNLKNPQIAPPNSYINLLDFKDLKSLGDYLNYLDKNDTAYNEYHQWRFSKKLQSTPTICKICEELWKQDDVHIGRNPSIVKISDFWNAMSQCRRLVDVVKKYLKK